MFEKLNDYLKNNMADIFEYDPFLVKNAYAICELYDGFYNIKVNYDKTISRNYDYISGPDNIALASSFLKQFGLDKRLNEELSNGMIEFKDVYEDYEDSYEEPNWHFGIRNGHDEILVPDNGNINDSSILIHEFIHSLNPKREYTRYLSTEFFAIYFQLKYTDYLLDKNINPDDILKIFKDRYDDCRDIVRNTEDIILLIGIYDQYGSINKDNLLDYDKKLNIEYYEDVEGNDTKYMYDYRYVLATVLATYALYNNIDPFVILKTSLETDKKFFELLSEMHIPLNTDLLVKTCQKYINEELEKVKTKKVIK